MLPDINCEYFKLCLICHPLLRNSHRKCGKLWHPDSEIVIQISQNRSCRSCIILCKLILKWVLTVLIFEIVLLFIMKLYGIFQCLRTFLTPCMWVITRHFSACKFNLLSYSNYHNLTNRSQYSTGFQPFLHNRIHFSKSHMES